MAAIAITAGNVLAGANAKTRKVTAGATVTAGQVVYESAGEVYLAQCDGTLAEATAIGITLGGAADGQPVIIDIEDDDFTPGGTLVLTAAGGAGIVIVSSDAGGLEMAVTSTEPVSGGYPVVLGVAKTTTKMNLKIVGPGGPLTA